MKTHTFSPYYFLLCFFFISFESHCSEVSSNQNIDKEVVISSLQKKITVKGTGQTTGHIATLSVHNTGDELMNINPQVMYIPSSGNYQPYVGRIAPGHAVPPGETLEIPIFGYCTDVHLPPVGNGSPMPPIESWITVKDPQVDPSAINGINIIPTPEVDPFSSNDIPMILASSAFNPQVVDPNSDIIATWPGSDIIINGTITLPNNEAVFAPMIIDAVIRIENAAYELVSSGGISTPFSNDSKREAEALIQQTTWIFMGSLTGEDYDKQDFGDQLIVQYESNTDTKIEDASAETVERLEEGTNDFWSSFELVGVEAKVISVNEALPSEVKEGLEKGMGKVDTSNVKPTGNADVAAGAAAGAASSKAGEVVIDSIGNPQPLKGEGAHVHSPVVAAGAGGTSSGAVVKGEAGAAKPSTKATKPRVDSLALGAAALGGTPASGETIPTTEGEKGSAVAGDAGAAKPADNSSKNGYNSVNRKADFNKEDRKTYDEYSKRRKRGMPHNEVCRQLNIDPNSDLGKALERVYGKN
jgi:hypothetical protein